MSGSNAGLCGSCPTGERVVKYANNWCAYVCLSVCIETAVPWHLSPSIRQMDEVYTTRTARHNLCHRLLRTWHRTTHVCMCVWNIMRRCEQSADKQDMLYMRVNTGRLSSSSCWGPGSTLVPTPNNPDAHLRAHRNPRPASRTCYNRAALNLRLPLR